MLLKNSDIISKTWHLFFNKRNMLEDPIIESDKIIFYDSMEKFISEGNNDITEYSSEESKFNLYIKLFLIYLELIIYGICYSN